MESTPLQAACVQNTERGAGGGGDVFTNVLVLVCLLEGVCVYKNYVAPLCS